MCRISPPPLLIWLYAVSENTIMYICKRKMELIILPCKITGTTVDKGYCSVVTDQSNWPKAKEDLDFLFYWIILNCMIYWNIHPPFVKLDILLHAWLELHQDKSKCRGLGPSNHRVKEDIRPWWFEVKLKYYNGVFKIFS